MLLVLSKLEKPFFELFGCLFTIGRPKVDIVADKYRGGWIAWQKAYMNSALIDIEENIVAKAVSLMGFFEIGNCSLDKIAQCIN